MSVRILPHHVASRIAAGEVVERPASVVKELVENALDAGATVVDVTVRGLSLENIIVQDNGIGMEPADLELALHRHATSKLVDDDILKVRTLGYRGEALPSIAAVADVRIVTRQEGMDVAFAISSIECVIGKARPSAGQRGTRVEVGGLFSRHPARLKFQKSQRTEAAAVREAIASIALCHPGVDFRFQVNGVEGRYPAQPSLAGRAADVLGKAFADDTVSISMTDGAVAVEGLAGLPSSARADASGIKFSVNGRPVSDRLLRSAVQAAYASLIGPGRHPRAFVALTLPPDMLDINVHPRKAEVRFARPSAVSAAVTKAVREAIDNSGLRTPASLPELARTLAAASDVPVGDRKRLPLGRFIGQANGSWIISETVDGIVIVDQHAAHERVIMERLKKSAPHLTEAVFRYPEPFVLHVGDRNAAAVHDSLGIIQEMGFSVVAGLDTVTLHAVPAVLTDCPPREIAALVVRCASEGAESGLLEEALWEKLATAACKAAIKAGERLSPERADTLLREIEATPNASHCNHGRPTVAFLKDGEIAKLFARG